MLVPVFILQLCCCRLGNLAKSQAYHAWSDDHVSAGFVDVQCAHHAIRVAHAAMHARQL